MLQSDFLVGERDIPDVLYDFLGTFQRQDFEIFDFLSKVLLDEVDLDNMLLVAESTAKSAIVREESRGGHTRDDFPKMDPKWRTLNNIASFNGKEVVVKQQPLPVMPKELFELFDASELEKYLSKDELVKGGR